MRDGELQVKTRKFALDVVLFTERLPKTRTADVLGKQLLRCGTSVGANYRAVCRARTTPDFVNKMGIVEEEADESMYWLDLLSDANVVTGQETEALFSEANSILSMAIASIKTAKFGMKRKRG